MYILKIFYSEAAEIVICEFLKEALNIIEKIDFKNIVYKVTLKRTDKEQ